MGPDFTENEILSASRPLTNRECLSHRHSMPSAGACQLYSSFMAAMVLAPRLAPLAGRQRGDR